MQQQISCRTPSTGLDGNSLLCKVVQEIPSCSSSSVLGAPFDIGTQGRKALVCGIFSESKSHRLVRVGKYLSNTRSFVPTTNHVDITLEENE